MFKFMNTKLYLENDTYVAGVTLKDPEEPEGGNMAIHTCINAENPLQNRRQLAAALNCGLEDFICANQTHSANFHKVTAADRGRGAVSMDDAIPNTDALYTFEPDLMLCCFTADCVPVIFYNEPAGLVGVIHSGWMGTVQEITPKLLKHLAETERTDVSDMHVFIGPAISQEKFEVDEDVCDRFRALGYANEFISYNELTHKYHIDNQWVVRRQCELQRISCDHIIVDRTCTYQSPEGFSWRQDKNCGRHMSFIFRRERY